MFALNRTWHDFLCPLKDTNPSNTPSFGKEDDTKNSLSPKILAELARARLKLLLTELPLAENTANSEQKTLQTGVEEEKQAVIAKKRKTLTGGPPLLFLMMYKCTHYF